MEVEGQPWFSGSFHKPPSFQNHVRPLAQNHVRRTTCKWLLITANPVTAISKMHASVSNRSRTQALRWRQVLIASSPRRATFPGLLPRAAPHVGAPLGRERGQSNPEGSNLHRNLPANGNHVKDFWLSVFVSSVFVSSVFSSVAERQAHDEILAAINRLTGTNESCGGRTWVAA